MNAILERTQVKLVLYGNTKPGSIPVQTICTTELIDPKPPSICPPPASYEAVRKVPVICSITPTSGSTGVPKSIVYPMKRALSTLDEESSTLLKPRDGQWLRGGTVSFLPVSPVTSWLTLRFRLSFAHSSRSAVSCSTRPPSTWMRPFLLRINARPSALSLRTRPTLSSYEPTLPPPSSVHLLTT